MPLPAAALRFDRFTLLPNERQLLAEGEPVKLGGRAFDLLLVLVERRERTVTRSELFELVWAGRIVEDHNLQVQVLALRKVLGPTAIATIPGRGYRFAMRLLDGPEQAAAPAAGVSTTVPTAAPATAPAVASMTAATSRAGALAQSNLPAVGSALHGRVNDIAAVFRLLGEHRLVTLAGAGGIGKTRLAQAVANQLRSRFPDGVWMVELASVGDEPEQICSALAGVLGLTASPLAGNADDLARALSSLDLLLVLDNCEHLVDSASTLVRALLERAPKVHVLVTSQEPLHARGEQVYRLGSLENGAVALFVERVQGADRRFVLSASNTAAVTDICRRLDGNPLAIELAAARTPLLGVEGVRSRLDERFRLLTGGASDAPQRHRTLLDTIEWSHSLLAADEQAVFRRLGVFAGSFSLDAARLVASGGSLSEWAVLDHLCALVDKSLVLVDGSADLAHEPAHDAAPRYRMLESPRAYALEALAACGEVIATRRRHAHVMLDLFARADDTYHLDPTLAWMARLAPDVHNCREAFSFSISPEGEPATAIGIAATAATFASAAGRGREGHRALQRAWPLLAEHATPQWQARAWLGLAQLGSVQAITPDEAVHAAQQAADAFRAIDDRERLYRALYMLSQYAENSALMPLAEQATEEMKRVESSEWPSGLKRLGRLRDARRLRSMGRIAESRDAFDDQAQRCLADGDEHRAWVMLHHVALAEVALGNFERAASVMRGAVEQIRRHGLMREMWQQVAMHALTEIECAIERGDPAMALPAVREVAGLLKVQASVWWLADHMAWLPELRGDSDSAARLLGWADAQARSRNAKRGPIMQKARDRLAARLENHLDADRLARQQADGAALRDDEVLAVALREPG